MKLLDLFEETKYLFGITKPFKVAKDYYIEPRGELEMGIHNFQLKKFLSNDAADQHDFEVDIDFMPIGGFSTFEVYCPTTMKRQRYGLGPYTDEHAQQVKDALIEQAKKLISELK